MKQKKDKIFVVVMGLVLVNLIYLFAGAVNNFVITRAIIAVVWIIADGLAIVGVLYLLRSYNRARKAAKKEKKIEEDTEVDNKNF